MPLSFREAVSLQIGDSLDLQEIAARHLRLYISQHYPGIERCLLDAGLCCASDIDGNCQLWIQYPPGKSAVVAWAAHWNKLNKLAWLWHRFTGLSQVVVMGPDVGKILVTIGEDPQTGVTVCDRVTVGGGNV